MDIQATLTTATPSIEFIAPTDEYGRQGTFSIVVAGLSAGQSVALARHLPASTDENGGDALVEGWASTGDTFSQDGEFSMRSMGQGKMRLVLTGAGPVRVRVWR